VPAGESFVKLLTAAHCENADRVAAKFQFPVIADTGHPAQLLDLIEASVEEPLSLPEFRQLVAARNRRPADVISVVAALTDLEGWERPWPPVLCLLDDAHYPIIEFSPLGGVIDVSPADVSEGILGRYFIFCFSNTK
jgi:hypothetical protein